MTFCELCTCQYDHRNIEVITLCELCTCTYESLDLMYVKLIDCDRLITKSYKYTKHSFEQKEA